MKQWIYIILWIAALVLLIGSFPAKNMLGVLPCYVMRAAGFVVLIAISFINRYRKKK